MSRVRRRPQHRAHAHAPQLETGAKFVDSPGHAPSFTFSCATCPCWLRSNCQDLQLGLEANPVSPSLSQDL